MAYLANRVKVATATTGTGTLTLGAASSNAFCTFAEAGITNGQTVRYVIEEGTDFEIGTGVYTTAGTTLTRAAVTLSKISGTSGTTKMNLAGAATVRIDLANEDLFLPPADDGKALGASGTAFADLFLASGGVINWNAGDVTVTHSANTLAFGGASSGYTFDAAPLPSANDAAALGASGTAFSDLFLASGAVINFNAGDVTLTHAANALTLAGGTLTTEGLFAGQDVKFTGVISPAQITSDQTDYAPTGHATASVFRLSTDATRKIYSISGQAAGRIIVLQNVGSFYIQLIQDDGATGTAAMRFNNASSQWLNLPPGGQTILCYDGTTARWRVTAGITIIAGQTEMEAGASVEHVVTPANQQYHPSAAKVWVQGTPNSTTIITSYNVTSLGDTATGQQTVTIGTDFSSANYCVQVTVGETSTTVVKSATVITKAAGSYIMNSVVEAASGSDPTTDWNSVGFGDQ